MQTKKMESQLLARAPHARLEKIREHSRKNLGGYRFWVDYAIQFWDVAGVLPPWAEEPQKYPPGTLGAAIADLEKGWGMLLHALQTISRGVF